MGFRKQHRMRLRLRPIEAISRFQLNPSPTSYMDRTQVA
jgi:hypothetical protein